MEIKRDAETALRFLRTAQKAETLIRDGYTFNKWQTCNESFFVHTPNGDCYAVYADQERCTCPDFEKHQDFCKHLLCAIEIRMEERMIEVAEAEETVRQEAENYHTGTELLCY